MSSGCVIAPLAITPETGLDTLPLAPSRDTRVVGDIRGVQLLPAVGGARVEFSEVTQVSWTSSALLITGTVDAPRTPEDGLHTTSSFPLADIDYVIVREYNHGKSEAATFATTMLGSLAGTFLLLVGIAFMVG